ncbi:hypothetical protein M3Y98_00676000 [Aphelenchoides besseyi]|nr:hypothetical protein M3Y98_00676000 [Aphelenchoides besseyi]KAI6209140.1 hypothetical protein M3Y96_00189600 [Aphelenchoides besseyi]
MPFPWPSASWILFLFVRFTNADSCASSTFDLVSLNGNCETTILFTGSYFDLNVSHSTPINFETNHLKISVGHNCTFTATAKHATGRSKILLDDSSLPSATEIPVKIRVYRDRIGCAFANLNFSRTFCNPKFELFNEKSQQYKAKVVVQYEKPGLQIEIPYSQLYETYVMDHQFFGLNGLWLPILLVAIVVVLLLLLSSVISTFGIYIKRRRDRNLLRSQPTGPVKNAKRKTRPSTKTEKATKPTGFENTKQLRQKDTKITTQSLTSFENQQPITETYIKPKEKLAAGDKRVTLAESKTNNIESTSEQGPELQAIHLKTFNVKEPNTIDFKTY